VPVVRAEIDMCSQGFHVAARTVGVGAVTELCGVETMDAGAGLV